MAYRVDYSKEGIQEVLPERSNNKSKKIWSLGIICLILLMGVLYPQKQMLEKLLIPGDAEVTKHAASELVANLQDGVGLSEAMQVFCEEIIANADIS